MTRIKPLYLLNAILSIVLLTSLLVNATTDKSGTTAAREYDPWKDVNDDLRVDAKDIALVIKYFGTSGNLNKTALLLELRSRIDSLNASLIESQSRIDSLNASLLDLEAYIETRITSLNASLAQIKSRIDSLNYTLISNINDLSVQIVEMNTSITELKAELSILYARVDSLNSTLTSKINELETQIAEMNTTIIALKTMVEVLNATKLSCKPDWDSEWVTLNFGPNPFAHNLHTTNVLLYMIGKDIDGTYDINQYAYGGEQHGTVAWGAKWYDLTETEFTIYRESQDSTWDKVRILIWKIPS